MTRPRSILTFERLFLLSLVLWIAQQALTWPVRVAHFEAQPAGRGNGWVLAVFLIAMALANIGIWFLAARRASVAGKWLAVAAAAISGVLLVVEVIALVRPGGGAMSFKLLALATSVLTIAAAVPLFGEDARDWFGEDDEPEEHEEAPEAEDEA